MTKFSKPIFNFNILGPKKYPFYITNLASTVQTHKPNFTTTMNALSSPPSLFHSTYMRCTNKMHSYMAHINIDLHVF